MPSFEPTWTQICNPGDEIEVLLRKLGAVNVEPVTLEARYVRLETLAEQHHEALCQVGLDPDLWALTPARATTREEMRDYIRAALDAQAAGTALPFVTIERASNQVLVSTRFMNIDQVNRRVELKTDALNQRSRDAIRRIGAVEEGTLRRHTVTWSGRIRDTVYFSILDSEWPRVKADLERKLTRDG